MNFVVAVHTDIGIKKKTNQDSALVLEAKTDQGNVLLACLCDGMGGLAKGEVASAALIKKYKHWFYREFPRILYTDLNSETIKKELDQLLYDMCEKIMDYGKQCGVNLGTTTVCLLIIGDRYYIGTVGDSRAYCISDDLYQLTKDQTFVQREIDMGRITPEEAEMHPQRNVLLQCIGASDFIVPDFYEGQVKQGDRFLLCSDGFRHVISSQEIYDKLNKASAPDPQAMKQALVYLTDLDKSRLETDNITAIIVEAEN